MSSTEPRVTFGMPVFNGCPMVESALESILKQKYRDFAVIVSDNASTDETEEVVLRAAKHDERVQYVRNDVNVGAQANFNRVLELAGTEYFAWAAADDYWEPRWLGMVVEMLDSRPEAVLAQTRVDLTNSLCKPLCEYKWLHMLDVQDSSKRVTTFLEMPGVMGKANLIYGLMRTDALKRIGGFCRDGYASDVLVLLRLACEGEFAIATDGAALFHKRVHHSIPNEWSTPSEYMNLMRTFYDRAIEVTAGRLA